MFEPQKAKMKSKPVGMMSPLEVLIEPHFNDSVYKDDNEDQVSVTKEVPKEVAVTPKETVKCKNVPYIEEEQEILQNINIVRNVKNLFVNWNVNMYPLLMNSGDLWIIYSFDIQILDQGLIFREFFVAPLNAGQNWSKVQQNCGISLKFKFFENNYK